jgi:putative ABC transport system ATP-binding protein
MDDRDIKTFIDKKLPNKDMITMNQQIAQNGFLQIKNLSKSFLEGNQKREVLQGCNLQVSQGEFVAIIGKSGSGKSTLLNLISGIDQPDHGEVIIDGQSLTDLNELGRTLHRRQNIGFVFQFFNLVPTLTVLENVTLPLELSGIKLAEAKQKGVAMLGQVDLEDRLDTYPDRLSGGEQQRVAIARALIHNPALVLADEPTGNLDQETGRNVLELLDRLTRRSGKNLIMVTHSRDNAIFADRIIELQNGCFRSDE